MLTRQVFVSDAGGKAAKESADYFRSITLAKTPFLRDLRKETNRLESSLRQIGTLPGVLKTLATETTRISVGRLVGSIRHADTHTKRGKLNISLATRIKICSFYTRP
jgi:hypothetical protein